MTKKKIIQEELDLSTVDMSAEEAFLLKQQQEEEEAQNKEV